MKNLQKLNDLAVRGGWMWKYEAAHFDDASMSHYVTPLVDRKFWEAVAKAIDAKKYEGDMWPSTDPANVLMYCLMHYLSEGDTLDVAIGKLLN